MRDFTVDDSTLTIHDWSRVPLEHRPYGSVSYRTLPEARRRIRELARQKTAADPLTELWHGCQVRAPELPF